jgi:glycine cleavage system H protein
MKYTKSHEWINVDGEVGTIGVSKHAQEELGEIVYVELPEVGREVKQGEEAAVLESTKAAADVYAPVSGTIVAVNEALNEESDLVNSSPEQNGWIFKMKITNPSELDDLMDAETYQTTTQ